MQGAGSIWNKNNWHWEEKDYTSMGKKFMTDNLTGMKINENGIEIDLYEVKEIKGHATIAIRKQKLIKTFEFEIEVYFKAKREAEECQGRIII